MNILQVLAHLNCMHVQKSQVSESHEERSKEKSSEVTFFVSCFVVAFHLEFKKCYT